MFQIMVVFPPKYNEKYTKAGYSWPYPREIIVGIELWPSTTAKNFFTNFPEYWDGIVTVNMKVELVHSVYMTI